METPTVGFVGIYREHSFFISNSEGMLLRFKFSSSIINLWIEEGKIRSV